MEKCPKCGKDFVFDLSAGISINHGNGNLIQYSATCGCEGKICTKKEGFPAETAKNKESFYVSKKSVKAIRETDAIHKRAADPVRLVLNEQSKRMKALEDQARKVISTVDGLRKQNADAISEHNNLVKAHNSLLAKIDTEIAPSINNNTKNIYTVNTFIDNAIKVLTKAFPSIMEKILGEGR